MAAATPRGDSAMAEGCWSPSFGGVAKRTLQRGWDMCCSFSWSRGAIVTSSATRGNAIVAEGRRQPTIGGVAETTRLGRLDMIAAFARRCRAVVASATTAEYIGVAHGECRVPTIFVMA